MTTVFDILKWSGARRSAAQISFGQPRRYTPSDLPTIAEFEMGIEKLLEVTRANQTWIIVDSLTNPATPPSPPTSMSAVQQLALLGTSQ